ncbi:ATP-dependent DNA helicase PIF1-like [Lycium barbarum]|uniref:ATP-dependent DNA helicase PIF1-like n=1 Tax=Lycium barbarum TaxID=112863 RepID=UPI00293E9ABF|nr:ATP-dependent DNA helicase PIF1-like [Lycium barbarum]
MGYVVKHSEKSAEKRGLLHSDSSLVECMCEAVSYQMPYSLRRLFATLLVYCNPSNSSELWKKFEYSLSEDFNILPNLNAKNVRDLTLSHINDILHLMGHDINEYKLVPERIRITLPPAIREAKDCHFERHIIVSEEDLLLEAKLTTEQRKAYDTILNRIYSNQSGAFFIDGPGGTGKTFLYRVLLATVRSKGFVALATATSGVAASILPGGRTAHSRFKFPIEIDEQCSCNISKQSSLVALIRDAKLIVWDEVTMAKKKVIEAFNLLLKNLMDTNEPFGGKVVVFGGDFRQTMSVVRSGRKEDFIRESLLYSEIWNPFGGKVVVFGGDFRQTMSVVRSGRKEDFIRESLLYSEIWNQLEKLRLLENMRAKKNPTFCEYLMRIGNGKEKIDSHDKIKLLDCFIIPFISENESLNHLFRIIYPDLHTCFSDISSMTSRVILTTKNDFVDEMNDLLIAQFPGDPKTYVSFDETTEVNDQSQYEDYLHTLHPAGLPPHRLILKKNCPVMLL